MLNVTLFLALLAAADGTQGATAPAPAALFPLKIGARYGYINRDGSLVLPATFEDARAFSEGLAPAKLDGKFGFIDSTGTFVLAPSYDYAWPFVEGLAMVKKGNRFAQINHRGEVLGNRFYEWVGDFSNGLGRFHRGGRMGFRDRAGREVIAPQFGDAGPFTSEGLTWAVARGKGCGYINRAGQWVIPPRYRNVYLFGEGLAGVRESGKDRKYGFISTNGVYQIPPRYDQAGAFADGLAPVMVNGRWGFIDRTGAMKIPPRFDEIRWFVGGRAQVRIGRRWTFIDTSGALIAPAQFSWCMDFRDGLALVSLEGLEGYLTPDGTWVWNPYRHVLRAAAQPACLLFILVFLPGLLLRRIASRALREMHAASPSERVARLYRLQKVSGGLTVGVMILLVLLPLAPWFEPVVKLEFLLTNRLEAAGWSGAATSHFVQWLLALIPIYASYLFTTSALFELDRLVRRTRWNLAGYLGMHVRALLVGALPYMLLQAAERWWPGAAAHPWLLLGGYLVTLLTFSPVLIHFIWRTRALNAGAIRTMVEDLSRQSGVHVTGVHLWSMPGGKVANAMIAGLFPICRVVFVSDTLLKEFSARELRVVLAHEFGHIKRWHLGWFGVIGLLFVVATAVLWSGHLHFPGAGHLPGWGGPVLNFAFVLAYLYLIRNYFSRKFEFQADRYAVEVTRDARSFASSMRKLARLNGQPGDWSRWHGLVVTHPGVEARIKAVQRPLDARRETRGRRAR